MHSIVCTDFYQKFVVSIEKLFLSDAASKAGICMLNRQPDILRNNCFDVRATAGIKKLTSSMLFKKS